ncbi:nucleotide kinase [Bacillus phage Aurora]|uniref:Uncharacterized protein n=1 Tax=Bacillus phage Aurora TaxID=1874000 RepID=A0A1B1PAC1_9CAUD|nr:nucleotide kinase [Bacillus phage Aurora]ANT41116.1 hypothetical protein AURORA_2 [Bacillus phage Aurora]
METMCCKCWKYEATSMKDLLCDKCRYEEKVKRDNESDNRKEDIINKPNHYHDNGVDPISIGEKLFTKEEMNGFYKMNMLKYWCRAGKKDNNSKEQDLKKYEFYRNKLEGNK